MRLRDRIRGRPLRREPVKIPEWSEEGERFYVRMLSGEERYALEEWMSTARGPDKKINFLMLMCKLVSLSLVDEQGARCFDDEDVDWLKEQGGCTLIEVFNKAAKLNRMHKDDQEDLVNELRNRHPLPSGSVSPAT